MEQLKNTVEPALASTHEVVPATVSDSDFVYELKKVVLRQYVEQTWQRWDEDFQRRFHTQHFNIQQTSVIKVGGKPIGTIDVNDTDKSLFVSGLYILPQYQSKGIGSKILQDLMRNAKKQHKRLDLEVLRVNIKAQALYRRLGFKCEEKDEHKLYLYMDF